MTSRNKKIDLIPELTTHKSDYKPWPIRKNDIINSWNTIDNSQPARSTSKPPPQIDYQSHLEYTRHVPFDLYIEAKPIVGTNPYDPIPKPIKSETGKKSDHFRYIMPGKHVIDVTDEDIISKILFATYHPVHRELFKEACLKVPERSDQLNCVLIDDRTEFVPKLYPQLPPGWIDAASHWDCLQSRVLGDPTGKFWARRGPEVIRATETNCSDLLPCQTKREIKQLVEKDEIRLPYSITKIGYAGYRPILAKGVSLSRKKGFEF